jgi:hypothetical protein
MPFGSVATVALPVLGFSGEEDPKSNPVGATSTSNWKKVEPLGTLRKDVGHF